MVLESIVSAMEVEKKPFDMLILSFFITLIVVMTSYFIFPEYTGIILPLLVTISMTPLVYKIFAVEERIERRQAEKLIHIGFVRRHEKTIKILTYFFIGSFLAVFLLMLVMPEDVLQMMFKPQIDAIKAITGYASYTISGSAVSGSVMSDIDVFEMITINNLKVTGFAFLLSFLFSTGSLFILSWNASILAIFLATFVRKGLVGEFFTFTIGILPHTPLEMFAYFFGAIAGGMLSVGFIREKWGGRELHLVLKDSLAMLLIAVFLVVLGAAVEAYI